MIKRIYPVTIRVICPRCGKITNHCIYDSEKGIYKCLICKTVHA